jgi:hypothetical protein
MNRSRIFKRKKVFKVVKQNAELQLASTYAPRDFKVEYAVGTKTVAKVRGTKLFVFFKLADALAYACVHMGLVYEAIATNTHLNGWLNDTIYDEAELRGKFRYPSRMLTPPTAYESCAVAESVTLVKRIQT